MTRKFTRAVIFDLDGTLVDSMPLVLRAFAHALEPACGTLTAEKIFAHLGGPPDRTFAALLKNEGEIAEAMQRLRDFSVQNWRLIQPFDGMHGLLDALRAGRQAVGLWTGRERESTEWILAEHGIGAKLDACVCGDDLATHKPDPGGLEEALRKLAVAPHEALFVGDADVDVIAGKACGVRTILIMHDRVVDPLVRAKAWKAVTTPAEAYAVVHAELGE
ncbi:MAG: phosphoglycolate phosphatase [Verrucomicrobia bacterium]|nr:phosphoglycolate phosphatase [Verrucomicrobiota bacterium]